MNGKSKTAKNQANTKNRIENVISKEELDKKIESVMKDLKSSTQRELETNGKFTKNDKLTFISDEMLIIGCDIGCETHYIRAVDARGRELSRGAFAFGVWTGGTKEVGTRFHQTQKVRRYSYQGTHVIYNYSIKDALLSVP